MTTNLVARTLAGGRDRGFQDGDWDEALFDRLVGVACISTGEIIIVDTFNHRIRLVHPRTGTTRTLSGSGRKGLRDGSCDTAMFHNPGAVAVAICPNTGDEELVIADTCSHAIRTVSLRDGRVTTLAGSKEGFRDGPAREALFAFPEGVAADREFVYVVDTDNNRIRVLDRKRGTVRSLTQDNSAAKQAGLPCFNHPEGVLVLPDGDLLIGDSCNHRLCVVDTKTGEVRHIAGKAGVSGHIDGALADCRFDTPRGLARTAWGEIAIADSNNDAVRMIDLEAGTVRTVMVANTREEGPPVKPAWFNDPFAVAVTLDGDLCVTEFRDDRVTLVADRLFVLKVELMRLAGAMPPPALRLLRRARRF